MANNRPTAPGAANPLPIQNTHCFSPIRLSRMPMNPETPNSQAMERRVHTATFWATREKNDVSSDSVRDVKGLILPSDLDADDDAIRPRK